MLRNDIKRRACEKMGIDFNQVPKEKEELLTGQTIGRSDIESFSSYKLMNEDEKSIVRLVTSLSNEDISSKSLKAKEMWNSYEHKVDDCLNSTYKKLIGNN